MFATRSGIWNAAEGTQGAKTALSELLLLPKAIVSGRLFLFIHFPYSLVVGNAIPWYWESKEFCAADFLCVGLSR
jgi:hypothetical protein